MVNGIFIDYENLKKWNKINPNLEQNGYDTTIPAAVIGGVIFLFIYLLALICFVLIFTFTYRKYYKNIKQKVKIFFFLKFQALKNVC